MTFSICVREDVQSKKKETYRYGIGVTTRMPGVGDLIPYVSSDGVLATQGYPMGDIGSRVISYLDDGLRFEDSCRSLRNADPRRELRQIHGLGAESSFVFTGDECESWAGGWQEENLTVAGNLLVDEEVLEAVQASYKDSDRSQRLVVRLINALAAGKQAGGDRRDGFDIQSAAVRVHDPTAPIGNSFYNDMRTNATRSPIDDLRESYDVGVEGWSRCAEEYGWN
jgi:uncharacterized Ntn-hydrolase superfamily protein